MGPNLNEGERYAHNGVMLRCDKGVAPGLLTVLPRPSRVNGQFQATTADVMPLVNIPPFGVCAITRGPCLPPMLMWTGAHMGAKKVSGFPPLLATSVCQCALGGRISITMPPPPGTAAAGPKPFDKQTPDEQDATLHEASGTLKELAGGLALVGMGAAVGGLFFPPLELLAAVALGVSEVMLVAAVVIDVGVAVVHPTVDNWLVVGGDVLAVGLGYVVGKVIVGPAFNALAKGVRGMMEREAAVEGAAALSKTAQAVAESRTGTVISSPKTEFGKLRMAYKYYKQAGWDKTKIAGHLQGVDFTKPVELVELPSGKVAGQLQANPAWKGNYFAEPGTDATRLGINPQGKLPDGAVVSKTETLYSTTEKTTVLRSSAAPVKDTWSVPGEPYQTEGGAAQYFHFNKDIFQPKK